MTSQMQDKELTDHAALNAAAIISDAQLICANDRALGMQMLDDLFRRGRVPDPAPSGRYWGEMVVVDIAPGLTWFTEQLVSRAAPWQGKVFDPVAGYGRNLIRPSAETATRLLWPFYRDYRREAESTVAFPFKTSIGPGLRDADRQVMRLDYNIADNPRLIVSVRRNRDELVQVDDGLLLGKWYVHWVWGAWSMVAFFTLWPEEIP